MNIYSGVVQKGGKEASTLGFPTINIPLEDASVSGIYAARVKIGDEEYIAAAFANPTRKVLEAYLLDFPPRDLYGETVSIELCEKIRESEKFKDDATLRAAIDTDVARTREYFKSQSV